MELDICMKPGSRRDLSIKGSHLCLSGPDKLTYLTAEEIKPSLLKQRSEPWHEVRHLAKVTGSTCHTAIGLSGLKKQKEHIGVYYHQQTKEKHCGELDKPLKDGVENKIDAVATLLSKVLPVVQPDAVYVEGGCETMMEDKRIPMSPILILYFLTDIYGMTCHKKIYSFTFCFLFLILVLFYVDLNLQPQFNGSRIKTRFYSVPDESFESFRTVSNEGLNIKFINVLNASNRFINNTNNNSDVTASVTTSVHRYVNRSMWWPAIQTTDVVPGSVRSSAHIVLVVSYMRSGSSLTADIMQHFPKSLYVFEPFHRVVLRTKAGLPLHYMDGTTRKLSLEDITDDFLQNELMKWIDCRLWELDIDTLTDAFHAQFSRSMQLFYKCIRGKPKTIKSLSNCVPQAVERCKEAKHRLFKFIRLPMRIIKGIFTLYPNLQVLHLVRDPRGTLTSQIRVNVSTWNVIDTTSRRFCHRVAKDLNTTLYLNYFFPNRTKILLYEKLAENPLEVAKKIYNYINVPSFEYVLRYVSKLTLEGRQGNNPFRDIRQNSTKTAYSWRDKIDINNVRTIDNNCKIIYDFIGYQKFTNTADLRNHYKPTMLTQNRSIFLAV